MIPLDPVGLYVHIPFCHRFCPYCAFYKVPYTAAAADIFLTNLLTEMARYTETYGRIPIDTLYLGGGTPNALTIDQLKTLYAGVSQYFDPTADLEFSMEINPTHSTPDTLADLIQLGVNRISVGGQSFVDRVLSDYGRDHSAADVVTCLEALRDLGIPRYSVDIIFGHPNHRQRDLQTSLAQVLALAVPHVALYGLTIYEKTPYHSAGITPRDDDQADDYAYIQGVLIDAGYQHYEVSNFAKPGQACRHNIKYWTCQPTIGLGAGAHSYFLGHRYQNDPDMYRYLDAPWPANALTPTPVDWADFISVRLRYHQPIRFDRVEAQFGIAMRDVFAEPLQALSNAHYIQLTDVDMAISPSGYIVLDDIIPYFL